MQQTLSFEPTTVDSRKDWRLDEATKVTGRRGIEQARQTLAASLANAA